MEVPSSLRLGGGARHRGALGFLPRVGCGLGLRKARSGAPPTSRGGALSEGGGASFGTKLLSEAHACTSVPSTVKWSSEIGRFGVTGGPNDHRSHRSWRTRLV